MVTSKTPRPVAMPTGATVGLDEFARTMASAIAPAPHPLSRTFSQKVVTVKVGNDRLRLKSSLTDDDFALLQRIATDGEKESSTIDRSTLRQLYRKFRQSPERPTWVPIPRSGIGRGVAAENCPPGQACAPSNEWPRNSPEWFAAQQAHIQGLTAWVAAGDLKAIDRRTRAEVKRADVFTLLLTEGLAKYLARAGLAALSDTPPGVQRPDANDPGLAASAPAVGSAEWSFQQTGRRPGQPWTPAHLETLVRHKQKPTTWPEMLKIYIGHSKSAIQKHYSRAKKQLPRTDPLAAAWGTESRKKRA